ncbi:MAG: alpha/beta fold hydrolase [Rhodospirillales bacterium]|nr:alpha/beta fold hydrolase [Rhodospirillales bacterium]
MAAPAPFRRRWPWVTADLQTVRNVLPGRLAGVPPDSGRRIEIPLSDESGDRLVARFHPGREPLPAVILVPGLTGCEASRHVLQSAGAWVASGAPVVRLNLRGAPPGRALARSHYHMDRVQDLADACEAVRERDPGIAQQGIIIVGFSLGGAIALRLAQAPFLPRVVKAVVAVSAPLDLVATAARMVRPRNRLYERWLLDRLRRETEPVWRPAPEPVRAAVQGARHIRDFDDALTAKEAGFRDAADYYEACSPVRGMDRLRIPTLLIHADDDPWIPPPAVAERPPLRVVVTRGGGHVGFHGTGSRLPWYVGAAQSFVQTCGE